MEKAATKVLALILAVVLTLCTGGWVGHKISESHHLGKITKLESDLAAARSAEKLSDDLSNRFEKYCGAIDAATQKQDKAIAELDRQAKVHEAATAAVTAQARKESATFQRDAASILAKRPPPGADGCTAASAEFDDELRAERKGAKP